MGRGETPAAAAWHAVADAAGVAEGTTLLDVGCGTGAFCRWAADRGALVHGADTDPGRIVAARRAVAAGDFRVAHAQRLPWPDAAFDVVTGFNVFQYAPDVEAALSEAVRVTRRFGRVAVCKWGPPARNGFFAFLGTLDPRLALAGAPPVDPVDLALERLGVDVVAVGEVPAPIVLPGDEALVAALASARVRAEAVVDDDDGWRARVLAAAAPHRQAGGGYRFENRLVHRVFIA